MQINGQWRSLKVSSDKTPILCESCKNYGSDEVIVIIDDDVDVWEAKLAIRDHILNTIGHPQICYTKDHGTFAVIDGKLFEEVIF